uniref:Uncharacterized protein n=1 Tax=Glossina palpalis gambiensis TaxID=67801 RepID=A0A1B0C589_9MUSC
MAVSWDGNYKDTDCSNDDDLCSEDNAIWSKGKKGFVFIEDYSRAKREPEEEKNKLIYDRLAISHLITDQYNFWGLAQKVTILGAKYHYTMYVYKDDNF